MLIKIIKSLFTKYLLYWVLYSKREKIYEVAGIFFTNAILQSGLFPLHLAIMENDPLIRETYVKRLISRGADVNAKALPVTEFLNSMSKKMPMHLMKTSLVRSAALCLHIWRHLEPSQSKMTCDVHVPEKILNMQEILLFCL